MTSSVPSETVSQRFRFQDVLHQRQCSSLSKDLADIPGDHPASTVRGLARSKKRLAANATSPSAAIAQ